LEPTTNSNCRSYSTPGRISSSTASAGQKSKSAALARPPNRERAVSTDVDDVIRAVVELGGTYPDVVQMLQQAKETGALASRFRVNALPEGGRELLNPDPEATDEVTTASYEVATPRPGLFGKK